MAQLKVVTSTVTSTLRTLGNTSQMKNMMVALLAIDSTNGRGVKSEAWKEVKNRFENFGFTAVYDRNLILLLGALFVAISRSGNQNLNNFAVKLLSAKAPSTSELGQGGSEIVLATAVRAGDGKCIRKILEKGYNFYNILKCIGVEDKYTNRCIARMGKITSWKRNQSKVVAQAVLEILQGLMRNVSDSTLNPQLNSLQKAKVDLALDPLIEKEKQFAELSKIKNAVTRVRISNKIKNIPEEAFKDFKKLKVVEILGNISTIGKNAFRGCENLETVTILPGKKVEWINEQAFEGCERLRNIPTPKKLLGIGASAFKDCLQLQDSVTLASVTSIGECAFEGCIGLKRVTIGEYLGNLPNGVFKGCNCLQNVTINSTMISNIGNEAFSGCDSLTSIAIPNGVRSIGNKAFERCTFLTEVTIPDSVKSISENAFSECRNIKTINGNGKSANIVKGKIEGHTGEGTRYSDPTKATTATTTTTTSD